MLFRSSLTAEGIADADAQAQKLLEAKTAYGNVLRTSTQYTERELLSLTYVALARIYTFFNQTEYAVKLYDEAIRLGDVKNGAYNEAIAAKQRLLKPQ